MEKPFLILINGLPGAGKTTLAKRLAMDANLPLFSRDGIYETLYDALDCNNNGVPARLGSTSFVMLYAVAGLILEAGQSLIVEGFFGRPDLRTAEFLDLQRAHDFEPFQILCRADGNVLLERFLARMESEGRHSSHQDRQWLEQNQETLLRGQLVPLALGGQLIEIETTSAETFNYEHLLERIHALLRN